jgi:hypothetical protein
VKQFILTNGLEVFLLVLIAFLIFSGIKIRRNVLKHIFFNLAAVFASIFLYEIYLSRPEVPSEILNDKKELFYIGNSRLGYAPIDTGEMVVNEIKVVNSTNMIYDVKYTMKNGIRYTPENDSIKSKHAIFLGGSFAFGGQNDYSKQSIGSNNFFLRNNRFAWPYYLSFCY